MNTIEKRSKERRKQLKSAIITTQNRHVAVPCRVREISDKGARLEVEQRLVPDTFELLIELDGLEADCEVKWRRAGVVGVSFLSPPRRSAPRRLQVLHATRPQEAPSLRKKPPKA